MLQKTDVSAIVQCFVAAWLRDLHARNDCDTVTAEHCKLSLGL